MRFSSFFVPILALLTFGGIWQTQNRLLSYHLHRYQTEEQQGTLLKNAQEIKPFLLGFENFIADIMWLKSIQYTGSNGLSRNFELLENYFTVITDLDPKFSYAYHIAALMLPMSQKYERAEALLLKGETELPQEWRISFDLGYLYFYYLEDYERAIAAYGRCLQKVGCLPGARTTMETLRAKSGKAAIALQHILQQYDAAQSTQERRLLLEKIEHLGKLVILQEITKLSPPEYEISEIEGQVIPKDQHLQVQIAALEKILDTILVSPEGKILPELWQSPQSNNPYIWDIQQQMVRPKRWER